MELPKELKYSDDYSWVKIKGDTAVVGVIEPLTSKVDEFVFIRLPEEGKQIKKGDEYVSLEAVKWSGHLTSPLSGKIIEVNQPLFDDPLQINNDPYKNWIMKIKISDKKEIDNLLDSEQIKESLESQR